MKHIIFSALLLFSLFWMGCPPDDVLEGTYYVIPNSSDSLSVEWVMAGETERRKAGIPPNQDPNTVTGDNAFPFFSEIELDLEKPDNLLPSFLFDSLFVYKIVGGTSTQVFSGVDDNDWEMTDESDIYRRFLLRL